MIVASRWSMHRSLRPMPAKGRRPCSRRSISTETAYLTQSGQLYKRSHSRSLQGKVYCFGPTFRAEKIQDAPTPHGVLDGRTGSGVCGLPDMMDLAEQFLSHIVAAVLKTRRAELQLLERDITKLERVTARFRVLRMRKPSTCFSEKDSQQNWGDDFGAEDETILSKEFDRPVIVHRYPAALKAFYMETDSARPDLALCMDVLAPEGYGEIIGGGQRIHSHENYWRVSANIICRSTRFSGIWIFVDTVRCRTPVLEWVLSGRWPGSVGLNMYARPSHS